MPSSFQLASGINAGMHLGHIPSETAEGLATDNLTLAFRPHHLTGIDEQSVHQDRLVGSVLYPAWRGGAIARVHLWHEDMRPLRAEVGVLHVSSEDYSEAPERYSLSLQVIDTDITARPHEYIFTKKDIARYNACTRSDLETCGFAIADVAHRAAFREMAVKQYAQVAMEHPKLRYEGIINSGAFFAGQYGYSALHRLGPMIISVDFMHVREQSTKDSSPVFAARASSIALPSLTDEDVLLSQRLNSFAPGFTFRSEPVPDDQGIPSGFAVGKSSLQQLIKDTLESELAKQIDKVS